MKNVLCLIDSLGSGGAQRQLVGLAELLQQNNYSVSLLWYHQSSFYKEFLVETNITYNNFILNNKIKKILVLFKYIVKNRPDVVIAYLDGPAIICSFIHLFYPKFYLIVSERNTTQNLNLSERIKFFLYRFATKIVANSYSQYKFIKQFYPKLLSKTKVITNFTDTSLFSPDPYKDLSVTSILHVLCVGRISPQKNIPVFLKALKDVLEQGYSIHVDWYGNIASTQYYQSCLDLIAEYQLSECFFFHKPENDIQSLYRKAQVFCLPSLYEGYPNVVCEAMSCGLPILCSDICDNPKIVTDGKSGFLFDPKNYKDISQTIIRFYKLDEEGRSQMSIYNRKIALDKFSKQRFFSEYDSLIKSFT